MSEDKQKQEFEAYLQGDSELSGIYQSGSTDELPVHLDDVILAASRRAVKSKPRFAFSPFASDWHVPLALAAVVVLSVGVVITMQREVDDDYLVQPVRTAPKLENRDVFSDISSDLSGKAESFAEGRKDLADVIEEAAKASEPAYVQAPSTLSMERSVESDEVRSMLGQMAPAEVDELVPQSLGVSSKEAEDRILSAESTYAEPQFVETKRQEDITAQQMKKKAREKQMTKSTKSSPQEVIVTARKREEMLADTPISTSVLEEITVSSVDQDIAVAGVIDIHKSGLDRDVQEKVKRINELWSQGEREKALEQLRKLFANFPKGKQGELKKYFPEDILNLLETD